MSTVPTFDIPVDQATPLSDRTKGLLLAVSSSVFIGASFIVKKKGLRAAGATGIRAGEAQVVKQISTFQVHQFLLAALTLLQAVEVTHTLQSRYGGLAC